MKNIKFIISALLLLAAGAVSFACSRVVFLGDDGTVLAGRTLDWRTFQQIYMYILPAWRNKACLRARDCNGCRNMALFWQSVMMVALQKV